MGMISSSDRSLKATCTFFNSFWIVSYQRELLFYLSNSRASETVLGRWIPNWWVHCQYRLFTLLIILLHWQRASLAHQAKVGSSKSLCEYAYSASSIGFESFRLCIGSQEVLPLAHRQQKCHPFVVYLRVGFWLPLVLSTVEDVCDKADESFSWWTISFKSRKRLPSTSTWG